MSLRGTYAWALKIANDNQFNGSIDERDGKLYFKGTTASQDQANKIWDAIKTIPTWSQDIVADIQSTGAAEVATYTVKAGDNLYRIASDHVGNPQAVAAIKELNKDVLKGGDGIRVGMRLKLPAKPVASAN